MSIQIPPDDSRRRNGLSGLVPMIAVVSVAAVALTVTSVLVIPRLVGDDAETPPAPAPATAAQPAAAPSAPPAPAAGDAELEPPEEPLDEEPSAQPGQTLPDWEDRLPACETLTAAEIEQAVQLPVDVDEVTPDDCSYRPAGTSSATVPVVRLDARRYPGGISLEDYQGYAESHVQIISDFWPELTRQPVDGLGETAEVLTYELGAIVLAYIPDTMIVLELQLDAPEGADTRPETAVRLAEIVIGRLT